MKAIGFTECGGPEVLGFVEVPEPVAGPRDLIVRVKAAGVNPVDAKVRRGLRGKAGPAGEPIVLGWDAAGIVEAAGPETRRFRAGDEVFFAGDVTRPGSYAERVAVDERIAGRKPRSLGFEEAAAIPLTAITAFEALLELLEAGEGEHAGRTLFILGGGGGVGSIAIQVAKRVSKLRVVASASRPESAALCRKMGADAVVDHSKDLVEECRAAGIAGADYILSNAERPDFPALTALLKPFGRICSILPVTGADLSGLFQKRGTLSFELMFARPLFGMEPERQGAILERAADLLDRKVFQPTLTTVLDWGEFRAAHERIDTAHTAGKIVLRVG